MTTYEGFTREEIERLLEESTEDKRMRLVVFQLLAEENATTANAAIKKEDYERANAATALARVYLDLARGYETALEENEETLRRFRHHAEPR